MEFWFPPLNGIVVLSSVAKLKFGPTAVLRLLRIVRLISPSSVSGPNPLLVSQHLNIWVVFFLKTMMISLRLFRISGKLNNDGARLPVY